MNMLRLLAPAVALLALLSSPSLAQDKDRTAGAAPEEEVRNSSDTYRQLSLFGDVFERVRAQYVEPVTDEKLVEYAINGMLMSLDPHSSYMNEKDYGDMQVQTRGEFGGLGIEVTMENGIVKVVSPIFDTPAYRAGVQSGDYITHLDDEAIIGLSLGDAVDRMRGKVGTSIKLTIRREGVAEPVHITLVRDIIKIESVKHEVLAEDIGYIRITQFNQNTDSGVNKAIAEFKEKKKGKLAGIILDLRNDPGGLLDQAIAVADAFLEKGEIVSTRGRHEQDTKRDNATPGDIAEGLPIVVLINSGSASASEIVAGALQDHRRAILLGTRSFGKGSVQTVIPLSGHGAMRLTTARYYTPSGRSIQAKGIDPDIYVEQSKIESLHQDRISEADLPGALDKDKAAKDKKAEEPVPFAPAPVNPEPGEKEGPAYKKKDDDAVKNDKLKDDYQLARAVDLIRGLSLYELRQEDSTIMPPAKQADKAVETAPQKDEQPRP